MVNYLPVQYSIELNAKHFAIFCQYMDDNNGTMSSHTSDCEWIIITVADSSIHEFSLLVSCCKYNKKNIKQKITQRYLIGFARSVVRRVWQRALHITINVQTWSTHACNRVIKDTVQCVIISTLPLMEKKLIEIPYIDWFHNYVISDDTRCPHSSASVVEGRRNVPKDTQDGWRRVVFIVVVHRIRGVVNKYTLNSAHKWAYTFHPPIRMKSDLLLLPMEDGNKSKLFTLTELTTDTFRVGHANSLNAAGIWLVGRCWRCRKVGYSALHTTYRWHYEWRSRVSGFNPWVFTHQHLSRETHKGAAAREMDSFESRREQIRNWRLVSNASDIMRMRQVAVWMWPISFGDRMRSRSEADLWI